VRKSILAWAGFSEGILRSWPVMIDEPDGPMLTYAVFRSYAKAKKRYADVRRVEIREIAK
jgi:hypothetical protein